MTDRAPDDAAETRIRMHGCLLRLRVIGAGQERSGDGTTQPLSIDIAGAHDWRGVRIVDERKQEMLGRCVRAVLLRRNVACAPDRLMKRRREHGHWPDPRGPSHMAIA